MIKLKEEQYFVNGDYIYTTMIHKCIITNRIYLSGFSKYSYLPKQMYFEESKEVEDIRLRRLEGIIIEQVIIKHYGGWEYKYGDLYLPSRLPSSLKITNQYGEEYDIDDFGFDQLR